MYLHTLHALQCAETRIVNAYSAGHARNRALQARQEGRGQQYGGREGQHQFRQPGRGRGEQQGFARGRGLGRGRGFDTGSQGQQQQQSGARADGVAAGLNQAMDDATEQDDIVVEQLEENVGSTAGRGRRMRQPGRGRGPSMMGTISDDAGVLSTRRPARGRGRMGATQEGFDRGRGRMGMGRGRGRGVLSSLFFRFWYVLQPNSCYRGTAPETTTRNSPIVAVA